LDYNVAASKERLSGRAYFNPQIGGTTALNEMPWLDLGNIQLMNLDYGIKRKEHLKARRGVLFSDRSDAYSTTPRWEITGDEFTSAILFLIFLGTAVADVSQIHGNQTLSFHAHHGGILDLNKFAVYNWVVPGATNGIEYVMDAGPGKLYVPLSSPWNEGDAHSVTFSWPDITFNKILPPLSNLNRTGLMQLIEEDDSPPAGNVGFVSGVASPKTVHDFPVSLSTDSGGQTKVDDYKAFKMIATVTDPTSWVIRKRST
jgi:hypothetical protein